MNKAVSSNGQIGWIGSNGRPDAAAWHSIIAREYNIKLPQLLTMCNQVMKQCNGTVVHHRVWPIQPKDIRLVVFVDSPFVFKGERRQQ
eukprot:6135678-Karenia_brevis.AAC.1